MSSSSSHIPPPRSTPVTVVARSMGMSRDAPDNGNDHDERSVVSDTSHTDTSDPHSTLVAFVQQRGRDLHSQQQQKQQHDSISDEYRGQAMAYLLNYETMVRQQEAEDMAVLAHIRPCVTRLLERVSPHNLQSRGNSNGPNNDTPFLVQEISLVELKQALAHLDQRTNDAIATQPGTDFFSTDRQFMMIIRLLSSVPIPSSSHDVTLTWAEFIQCYKVCIAGMVTLQHLPVSGDTAAARTRARNRTIQMLQLFTGVQNLTMPDAPTGSPRGAMHASISSASDLNKTDKELELYSSLTDILPRGNQNFYKSSSKEILPKIFSSFPPKASIWMSRSLTFMVLLALILFTSPYLYDLPGTSRGRSAQMSNVSFRYPFARTKSHEKKTLAAFLNRQRTKEESLEHLVTVESHEKSDTTFLSSTGAFHFPTKVVVARGDVTLQRQPCNSLCRPLLGIWSTFL